MLWEGIIALNRRDGDRKRERRPSLFVVIVPTKINIAEASGA